MPGLNMEPIRAWVSWHAMLQGDLTMKTFKCLTIVAAASVMLSVPALARSHHHRHHHHYRHHSAATDIYLHNYGPSIWPDRAFAYYDGPASVRCKQSAASYRGQDGRRHPCN
jgi:hypothetical protein